MLQLAHLHFADPLVQVLLRREESLHAALVERVVLPGRVLEPAVLLVGFAFRFAEQDFGILAHDLARRLRGRHRIGYRRAQHHRHGAQQFLPVNAAEQRVKGRRALRRILGDFVLRCAHFQSLPDAAGLSRQWSASGRSSSGLLPSRKKTVVNLPGKFVSQSDLPVKLLSRP